MAIAARFIDGVSYDDPEIAEVYETLHGVSFVIPSLTTDNLAVVSSGAADADVVVGTGIAQVLGHFYENTADVALSLDAQAAPNNRIDRIVLRRSTANQTIRATIIKGAAGATPAFPALTAQDMPLAWVWVPSGFTAATQVAATDIHDDRTFGATGFYHDSESMDNLLPNSEWLAWSLPATTVAPDYWTDNIAAGTITAAAILGDAPRGQAAQVTLANNEYLECNISLPTENVIDNANTPMTLWGNLSITSGGPLTVSVTIYPAATDLVAKNFYQASAYYNFCEHFEIDYDTYSTQTSLAVRYVNTSGGNVTFKCDPPILTRGFIVGPPRQKHEIIPLTNAVISDAGWNATAKSSATAQIDLTAVFGPYVPRGVRAVSARMAAYDTASAGAANPIGIEALNYYPNSTQSGGRVEVAGQTNSTWTEDQAWVGIDFPNHSFTLQTWATGAGTLVCMFYITGIAT